MLIYKSSAKLLTSSLSATETTFFTCLDFLHFWPILQSLLLWPYIPSPFMPLPAALCSRDELFFFAFLILFAAQQISPPVCTKWSFPALGQYLMPASPKQACLIFVNSSRYLQSYLVILLKYSSDLLLDNQAAGLLRLQPLILNRNIFYGQYKEVQVNSWFKADCVRQS